MSRRAFLRGSAAALGASLLAGACRTPRARAGGSTSAGIRAVAFDLFTIFNPRSIEPLVAEVVGDDAPAFAAAWRAKQFEYAFMRAAAGHYADFEAVTSHALVYTATARKVELADAARARLVAGYSALTPWPDAPAALARIKALGLTLAPLANYAPGMIRRLLDHAGLSPLFAAQLSTDAVRTYKPDPRAYQLGVDAFGVPPAHIAFAAFGGWDAAGATWFGYRTFWVNRFGLPPEQLAVTPEATGKDLDELAAWLPQRTG